MATNTLSSAFRKLDIDQYNEDLFVDESGGESAELVQVPGPDEAEINALLNGYPFYPVSQLQQHINKLIRTLVKKKKRKTHQPTGTYNNTHHRRAFSYL